MVYEPINHWLKSPEAGLRYHRSMNEDKVYDGCLDMATFGRPVLGLQKVEAYEYQSAAEGAQQNPNLSRSPGGLANPNGGAGYVAPHPTGSFWLLPSRRLLETTQQQVIDKMTSSLSDYREVVVETRKHQ